MAVDTRNKRASVLGVNSSAPRLEQNPSGRIQHIGRHMAGLIYAGITVHVLVPTFANSSGSSRLLSTGNLEAILS